MIKPKHPRKQSEPTAEQLAEEKRVQEAEEEAAYQGRLERFPPNKKFYSYSIPNEDKWRRIDKMPTVELLDEVKAERWTGGLIGGLAAHWGSFVVTGIHHDSRLLEFEYVYDGKRLLSYMY